MKGFGKEEMFTLAFTNVTIISDFYTMQQHEIQSMSTESEEHNELDMKSVHPHQQEMNLQINLVVQPNNHWKYPAIS